MQIQAGIPAELVDVLQAVDPLLPGGRASSSSGSSGIRRRQDRGLETTGTITEHVRRGGGDR